jgi:MtrB/PioB family decaheme-associated outer membrane protein
MIPHNFGNGGKSLLRPTSESAYRLSDDLQGFFQSELEAGFPDSTSYDNILALVTPSLDAAPADIDLRLERGRNKISFSFAPKEASYDLGVTYFHERRSGTRAANGTSFGFSNVVETPEPLRYITQDFGINGSVSGSWGVARAAIHFNDFKSTFAIFDWDNPFSAVDGTGGRAYLAPSAFGGLAAPKTGRLALPPDNKAITGSLGATFRFGSQTRLTVDGAFGQWKQDEEPFIAYTTNTAIELPGALPADRLDGKIDTTSLSAFFTTRLADNFRLNARYRRYDLENKTPRLSFPGYVRFDAVWEEIPRIGVPYGYANDYFDAMLNYDFGKASLEAGYKYTRMERTFRESEKTSENGFRLVLDVQGTEWVTLRALYELAKRDYDEYDTERSEHASYLEAGDLANQPTLRRFDQAKRDLQRYGGTVQIAPPSGKATLFFHYVKTAQEFDTAPVPFVIEPGSEAPLGLVDSDYETFTVEGDFVPSERATFYAFYSRENIDDFQRGRQSGGTLNLNPEDTWTSTVADKVDSFGAGADFVLVPEKWDLGLFARWQKADGNNAFTGPRETEDIPLFDDTELTHVRAWLKYHIDTAWAVSVGGFFEDYEIQDAQTDGTLNYMPGSFFLATNLGDYQAWVGWINLKYSWQ